MPCRALVAAIVLITVFASAGATHWSPVSRATPARSAGTSADNFPGQRILLVERLAADSPLDRWMDLGIARHGKILKASS